MLAYVLLLSPVSGLVFAGTEEVEAATNLDSPAPVVMVVFDELPGHALMNADRRLDAVRFPNFAALGEDAVWYRNATTSRSDTELAVPTLATGIRAPLDSLGTSADHPRSLFTLLQDSHEMHVAEPWTNICPERLCDGTTESLDEGGLGSILGTIPSILGYVSLPDAERIGISSPRESGAPDRSDQVATFVEEIEPAAAPVLHFLHVLLPHKAWRYLPSGDRYSDTVGEADTLGGLERWDDDEWLTLQHEQRFLLQLRYTDRLLGDLLQRLRDTGLYERSLIVVTADHGVSFRAGERAPRCDRDECPRHPLGAAAGEAATPARWPHRRPVREHRRRRADDRRRARRAAALGGGRAVAARRAIHRPPDRDRELERRRGRADPVRVRERPRRGAGAPDRFVR